MKKVFAEGRARQVRANKMKRVLELLLFVVFVTALSISVAAQDDPGVAPAVETLRSQLHAVQVKEAELKERAQQLDEALKPENIERSLAGVGSTRPEELRESRRRQLSIEREGVSAQLKFVATSRERLESVIRTAETQTYLQSASGSALNQASIGKQSRGFGWLVGAGVAIAEILGLGMLVILAVRRLRRA